MPAKSTEQLFATHSQYLDASASEQEDFRNALNEVMPRIYKMGYWREMLVEHTQDASDGYISLPQDTDSIVSGILDNNPLPTRSLWHDYKLFGTNDNDKTDMYAFVDDGYSPVYRDLVSGNRYSIVIASVKLGDGVSHLPNVGSVSVRFRQYSDATEGDEALLGGNTILKGISYSEKTVSLESVFAIGDNYVIPIESSQNDSDVTEILSISWSGVEKEHPFIVKAVYEGVAGGANAADSTKDLLLAEINTANGSSRYRRFRVGGTDSTSSAHMLLKRKWVDVDSTFDLVHMPSNAMLKHALLGKLAEDNSDIERAQFHWGTVAQLLETDTDSYRGAAKPNLKIAPNGVGSGMMGMY